MPFHDLLLALHSALGYQTNPGGLCYGFSMRWLEAALLSDGALHAFEQRMNLLRAVSSRRELIRLIQSAKRKTAAARNEMDKRFVELPAFFDSLELYQSPASYAFLFNRYYSQLDWDSISLIASSEQIQDLGGLSRVYSEPFIYSNTELRDYFNELAQIVEETQTPLRDSVGILLNTQEHALALRYKPGTGWRIRDINYPNRAVTNIAQLVEAIVLGLKDDLKSSYLLAHLSLFVTKNDLRLEVLKKRLIEFRKKHLDSLNSEMAGRAEVSELAFIAAKYGHTDVLKALAIHPFVDLNKAFSDGRTPVYFAAQEGHMAAIAELATHPWVALNKACSDGRTPVYIAAQHARLEALAELARHRRVDLNQAASDGTTPVYIAASKGYARIIAEFVAYHPERVNLNQARADGATPVFVAALYGHADVIAALATHPGVNLNPVLSDGLTPISAAVCFAHIEVINLLLDLGVDIDIPFYYSVDDLKLFASTKTPAIISRMNAFLRHQGEGLVSMLPIDMACVMGDERVIQRFKAQEDIERYKAVQALFGDDKPPVRFFDRRANAEGQALQENGSRHTLD